jgi:hypothetical protein
MPNPQKTHSEETMASFTNGKPWRVTQEQANSKRWAGVGLACSLCGHKFTAGDVARWVYANSTPEAHCGNFFVCVGCDGPDVLKRGIADFEKTYAAAKRWGILFEGAP